MKIKRPNRGDVKTKISYCIIPLFTEAYTYWFHKVKIYYTYKYDGWSVYHIESFDKKD